MLPSLPLLLPTLVLGRLLLISCPTDAQVTSDCDDPESFPAWSHQNGDSLDVKIQQFHRNVIENVVRSRELVEETLRRVNITSIDSLVAMVTQLVKQQLIALHRLDLLDERLVNHTEETRHQLIEIGKRLVSPVERSLDEIFIRIQQLDPPSGILVQQHYNGTSFFSRTWNEFKVGFGDVTGNYWIGNDRLHELTKDGDYKLRVDLKAMDDSQWYWAEYQTFRVGNESTNYTLQVGGYRGTAGDSLEHLDGAMFSTHDRDNDRSESSSCCVDVYRGNGAGFWYNFCSYAYINSPRGGERGFIWDHLPIGSKPDWSRRKLAASRLTLLLSQ